MNKIRWRERARQPVLRDARPRLTNRRAQHTRLQHDHVRSSPDLFTDSPIPRRQEENRASDFWEIDPTVSIHRGILKFRFRPLQKTTLYLPTTPFEFPRGNKIVHRFKFLAHYNNLCETSATKSAITFPLNYSNAISASFMCRADA